MKRAIIHLQISAHELKGHELMAVIPKQTMDENGVPQTTIVHIDGEDEEQVLRKVREWIALAKG